MYYGKPVEMFKDPFGQRVVSPYFLPTCSGKNNDITIVRWKEALGKVRRWCNIQK